ncbi:hypothetical protein GBAR_LOCUS18879, partial [Geodia barretti]
GREREGERGRRAREREEERAGEERVYSSLLGPALQFTQRLLQPHQLSGQLRATYKPSHTPLLGGIHRMDNMRQSKEDEI